MNKNKEVLSKLEQRNREFQELEKSMLALHEIFNSINILVSEQGVVIENIADNVNRTEVHVEYANEQLTQAVEYQSSARKKKIILAIICVLIIAIIVGIVIWQVN